jgi:hypothetical protein
MKLRIAKTLLLLPALLIDCLSLPIVVVNWILTGNVTIPLSAQITEQKINKEL